MTQTADAAVTIRPARLDDAEALAPLMAQLRDPGTPAQVRARLERLAEHADYHMLVAERDGRVIGMAGLMRGMAHHYEGTYARVVALAVSPEARGGGVGTALMRASEAWAREVGAGSVHLTSGIQREEAHRFYRTLGYEATGVRFFRKLD